MIKMTNLLLIGSHLYILHFVAPGCKASTKLVAIQSAEEKEISRLALLYLSE